MPYPKSNFVRMMQMIDEVFATRNDPDQLQVTNQQRKKLEKIHHATLSELADDNGPLIWVLIIPTTSKVMEDFINGFISEKELLERTNPGDRYEAIYLCSASTLPEERGKGKTKKLCIEAIKSIMKEHSIKSLFVWPFTKEGNALAESLAGELGLNLLKRTER